MIEKMYMNVATGSVDNKAGWIKAIKDWNRDSEESDLETFEKDLRDRRLIEVIWLENDFEDDKGQWVEA